LSRILTRFEREWTICDPYAPGMTAITVRAVRPGDGEALTRIHRNVAVYYAEFAPEHLHVPILEGFAEELDAESESADDMALHLVAEADSKVVGALAARLLVPGPGAERQITPDLGETRLRIEYLAIDEAWRRQGVGTRLVETAEGWGRSAGAKIAETSTYYRSPLSIPFWEQRMGYEELSVNLRKQL
jgi:GNAT superfamily N-acetyltransferase